MSTPLILFDFFQSRSLISSPTKMEFNHQQRQVLCSLAQAEMKRQKQLKQLEAIDDDIVEYLKKFLVSSTIKVS